MGLKTGLGLVGALPVSFKTVQPTAILAGTLIATALLLGLVGLVSLVGLLRRRAHPGPRR